MNKINPASHQAPCSARGGGDASAKPACRDHAHHHHSHTAGGNIRFAFFLNLAFTIIEIAGGFWTNSVAILSDALHDFGDCFSLGLAWYFQKLSSRRPDATFTYGYRRFSTLGALITGLVLIGGLIIIVKNAVERLQDPADVHAGGMLGLAVVGILFNGYAAWRLHGGESLNERVVSWHLLEDTLGWAAVLVGSAVMMIWDVPIVDPILSLLISLFILYNVFRNVQRVAMVFLQSVPPGFDVAAFDRQMRTIEGVIGSHHTHTWTNDGESHVFSTHLVMAPHSTRESVVAAKKKVHEMLREQKFAHVTVEVELEGETCAAEPEHGGHST